jgi:4'-phosphopantetheinyl transferase
MKSSEFTHLESVDLSIATRSVPPASAGGINRQLRGNHPKRTLADDEVHVWRVPLDQNPERTASALQVLSSDERETAARYHFDKDRNQFVQARAALRLILGEYLNVDPRGLEFNYGPQGKPALANHFDDDLRFNLSRRDGLALIAITRGREIGVDVELQLNDIPFFEVAAVSFSAAESRALSDLPKPLRTRGFFNCWTRKEAFVKACGNGLSFPLKQFDVSLAPGEPASLLEVRTEDSHTDEALRWTLHDVAVDENYCAALVVEGSNCKVSFRNWEWPELVDACQG